MNSPSHNELEVHQREFQRDRLDSNTVVEIIISLFSLFKIGLVHAKISTQLLNHSVIMQKL